MWPIAALDFISLLANIASLVIVMKVKTRTFPRNARIVFAALLFISLVYNTCLFLQWSNIANTLDPVEDVIGALIPTIWAFFFYAFLQDTLNLDLSHSKELLAENERKLHTLLGNLPGMAFRCLNEREWPMEFVSQGCLELTEYKPEDLTGYGAVSYGSLIHRDDRNTVWEQVQESLARAKSYNLEYRIRTASGREKWVWEQGVGVLSGTGDLVALEGFVIDISAQRQAQDILRKAHGELEAKVRERTKEITDTYHKLQHAYQKIKNDQEKIIKLERQSVASRITLTMAHETRNPISVIGGFARLLKRKHVNNSDLIPYFDAIVKEVEKLEHLIKGILKASREVAPEFEKMNLQKMLRELDILTQDQAHLSEVKVIKKIEIVPETIRADKESLVTALNEILVNAIEASPKNEEVVLRVFQEGEWIVFSVSDRGKGIDAETLSRIYDPFFSTKNLPSGMGLSHAKELIESQNGYIRLDTKEGKGTEVYIYLPFVK